MLPEDCVSIILSLTTPLDACRSTLVSRTFRLAAESNVAWEKFLPSDYQDIVSRSITSSKFSSKKELYLHLCNPILIDGGRKVRQYFVVILFYADTSIFLKIINNSLVQEYLNSFLLYCMYIVHFTINAYNNMQSFKLDKSSGKKSYVLSARELSITRSDRPEYWSWKPSLKSRLTFAYACMLYVCLFLFYFKISKTKNMHIFASRFLEVAELRMISWFEIEGKIRTHMLSPSTMYRAYLLITITHCAYGLDFIPSETFIEMGNQIISANTAYLSCKDMKKHQMECLFYGNRTQRMKSRVIEDDERFATERDDRWMEIELGEFFSGDEKADQVVQMSLREIKGYQLKGGLVIEGIEVRPK